MRATVDRVDGAADGHRVHAVSRRPRATIRHAHRSNADWLQRQQRLSWPKRVAAGVRLRARQDLGPACIGRIGLYVRYIVRSTFKQKALGQGKRALGKQGSPGIMAIWRIVDRRRMGLRQAEEERRTARHDGGPRIDAGCQSHVP